jgi:hypothetical protein
VNVFTPVTGGSRALRLFSRSPRDGSAPNPRTDEMSKLAVFDFDGIHTTDVVLNKLNSLQREYLIDPEDACVVERGADGKVDIKADGKVNIEQAVKLTACG